MILDWVPAHFPVDAHGLARFDGTALYEYADPREGFHRDWNTYIYNFGRPEVRNFLVGNALYWIDRYGVDGLRVDAVASMLYRDYSRKSGEWLPNRYGGRENLEAISLLKHINEVVGTEAPGAVTMAEESTTFPNVTEPTYAGGLGFHFKWNMGWMHDTLQYMRQPHVQRRWHHEKLTFGLVYAFSENFLLPLSHDEVVHGKGSLIGKMPGDDWQHFANLRAYYGFMWAHPGKKLLFMGQEFAQDGEWNHDAELPWHLLDSARNAGVRQLVRDLNRVYRELPAMHRQDCDGFGFDWLESTEATHSLLAWLRRDADGHMMIAVSNMTPVPQFGWRLGVPEGADRLARGAQHRLVALRRRQRRQRVGGAAGDAGGLARPRAVHHAGGAAARHHLSRSRLNDLAFPRPPSPGAASPMGAHARDGGVNFAVFSQNAAARRAVPVRRGRRDRAEALRAARPARRRVQRLPAGRRRRPGLRPARARPVRPVQRPSLQRAQAAARPVRARDRRPLRVAARAPRLPAGPSRRRAVVRRRATTPRSR